jgi:imidazolonepropionase-like amidohydrolase
VTSQWTLITNVSVVDGTRPEPRGPASVLIEGERISALGDESDLRARVPRGEPLTVADFRGRYLMPGLIDAHCHMTYGDSYTQEEQDLYTSVESRTLRAAWNARRVLRAGVTSISQPGGSYYIGVALRDAIARGMVPGPRMRTAGRYVTTSNGLTDWYPEDVGVPDGSIGTLANTPAEMTDTVRRQVKNGVDFIKLADSPFGEYQAFTGDELKQIADLAHQLGKKVTIHARGSAEVSAAVAAGFDWIMHGNIMTDEVIEALAAAEIPLVPTLLLLANAADYGTLVGTPAPFRNGCRRMLDKTADTLHRAHAAGVRFALGTDTGFAITPYGEWHARELELLMDYAGLSAQEALQAGTAGGARAVGLEGQVGEVRAGMLADLLVVRRDPLADIRSLQVRSNIEAVFLAGAQVAFDGTEENPWPNERSITYASATLTWAMAHDGAGPPAEPTLPLGAGREAAGELAHEITRAGQSAARSSAEEMG